MPAAETSIIEAIGRTLADHLIWLDGVSRVDVEHLGPLDLETEPVEIGDMIES